MKKIKFKQRFVDTNQKKYRDNKVHLSETQEVKQVPKTWCHRDERDVFPFDGPDTSITKFQPSKKQWIWPCIIELCLIRVASLSTQRLSELQLALLFKDDVKRQKRKEEVSQTRSCWSLETAFLVSLISVFSDCVLFVNIFPSHEVIVVAGTLFLLLRTVVQTFQASRFNSSYYL